MNVIDMHAHAWTADIAHVAVSSLTSTEHNVQSYYDGTVPGLIASMDRAGISRSLVAPVATKPSQVLTINNWMLTLPTERIIPFGAMHPDFPDPAAELERIAGLGIKGIKLHSQNQDFWPEELRMKPIYDAAKALGLIVLFHAGGFVIKQGVEAHPVNFAAMLDDNSGLTCILAHMGSYLWWDEVCEHLCGRDVYLDTAYCPRHLPDEQFLSLIRSHGVERVLFGTDGPWADSLVELAHIKRMGLSERELRLVLAENAGRLLGEAVELAPGA